MADFRILTKTMKNYIKVQHHLSRVIPGGKVPVRFLHLERKLIRTMFPAHPAYQTALLLEANAKNWTHSLMCILHEHYTAAVKTLEDELKASPKDSWEQALAAATIRASRELPSLDEATVRAAAQKIKEIMTSGRPEKISRATQYVKAEEEQRAASGIADERPADANVKAEQRERSANGKAKEQKTLKRRPACVKMSNQ